MNVRWGGGKIFQVPTPQKWFCRSHPAGQGALFGRGHCDQGGAKHTVGDLITLLQHRDHGVGFLLGGHHADGLVVVRIELGACGRVDGQNFVAFQRAFELSQSGL